MIRGETSEPGPFFYFSSLFRGSDPKCCSSGGTSCGLKMPTANRPEPSKILGTQKFRELTDIGQLLETNYSIDDSIDTIRG